MSLQYMLAIAIGCVGVFGAIIGDTILVAIGTVCAILVAFAEYSTNKKSLQEVNEIKPPEPVAEPVKKPRTRKPAAAKTAPAVKKPAAKKAPAKKVK